jgi:hypothetical protein
MDDSPSVRLLCRWTLQLSFALFDHSLLEWHAGFFTPIMARRLASFIIWLPVWRAAIYRQFNGNLSALGLHPSGFLSIASTVI